jgi:hypothetical protein
MWSVIFTLKTALSYAFYVSFKIGQFIVTSLSSLWTNYMYLHNKFLTLLIIILEDFTVFLRDVVQYLHNFVSGVVYIFEYVNGGVCGIVEKMQDLQQFIFTSIKAALNSTHHQIITVVIAVRNIFVFVKQILILFGDGVWFIIVYIQKSLLSLGSFILHNLKKTSVYMCNNIYNNIKLTYNFLLESLCNCYNFITDVPLESVIGILIALCFLYIFLQFYGVLYMYFREKMSSCITGLRLMYHQLKRSVNRVLSQPRSYTRSRSLLEHKASTSCNNRETKINDDRCCIICQENIKCILILPCKHLCLCSDCTTRLMRYGAKCPVCRKPINSTMKVFI